MFKFRWTLVVCAIYALASKRTSLAIVVTTDRNSTATNITDSPTSTPSSDVVADAAIVEKTAALPLQMFPPNREQMSSFGDSSVVHDAFELFKHLVYPTKFAETAVQHHSQIHPFARNITLDALQMLWPGLRHMNRYVNASWTPSTAIAGSDGLLRRSDEPNRMSSATDAMQDRHLYYSLDGNNYPQHQPNALERPHTFYPGGGGYAGGGSGNAMTHLIDPLFVMATLAFVAFLINSILGLVDRLNLIPSAVIRARHRHGRYSAGNGGAGGDEFVVWPERRTQQNGNSGGVGDEMLEELEQRIRTAFDEYERCYVGANCK